MRGKEDSHAEQLVARADHRALVRRVDRGGLHVGATGSTGSLRNAAAVSHLHPIAHVHAVSDAHAISHRNIRADGGAAGAHSSSDPGAKHCAH